MIFYELLYFILYYFFQQTCLSRLTQNHLLWDPLKHVGRGIKLIFTGGHISLVIAFKGLNGILGLYKFNYSLTVKQELGTAAK